ncbi:DNA internalization-related competence protein ComEC/Rec2 [Desulfocurvus sp.]|jgi:competence protein ComEC|uniref:DNA internalization-related competence protein ComEC/Rec2 n=1 Tax=Desulfocurvus sp. TaxID=2871698 RepID=UPI0025C30E01|nr:DNA internalization-related competence protein ComEC/Rec2 [Desulfocurvus sp.]MCK9239114.1 DNA internalization-related competence protein ComEC/Rec2 [Desulfocurvus sp.]
MRGADASPACRAVPGLLPWQFPFCALLLGLLALRFPWPALAGLVLLWALAGERPWRRAALLGAAFALGWGLAARALPAGPDPQRVPEWMAERRVALVSGRVERVESTAGRQLRVFLADARFALDDGPSGALPGLFLWTWQEPAAWPHPGQSVQVRLRVRPVRGFANPGAWDTRFHWGRQGVFYRGFTRGGGGHPLLGPEAPGPGARLRQELRAAVAASAPEGPGRALLEALVLGERFGVAREAYDTVRRSTLAHSLALSGMHLGFAAALGLGLAWVAGRLWPGLLLRVARPRLGVVLGAPLVGAYVWLGGATPSLLRAGVMFAAWGALLLLGRGRVLLDGLFLALAVLVAVDPLVVHDVRLQLSAVAVAGIAVLGPPLWRLVPGRAVARGAGPAAWAARGGRALAGVLVASVAANVALLPLLVWNFTETGLALPLNALWLPVLGLAVVPAGLAGALLSLAPGLEGAGRWLFAADAALLDAAVAALAALDARGWLPVAVPMRPLWPHLVGYYALLAGGAALVRSRGGAALGVCLAGALLVAWPGLWARATGQDRALALTLLDVGQSQAALLDLPGGGRVLVDGGGGFPGGLDPGRAVVLPALARGRWPGLDVMILSHPDHDHYGGLAAVAGGVRVGAFVHGGRWPEGEAGAALRAALGEDGVPVRTVRAGQALELGHGVVLEVLHPADQEGPGSNNDQSLVLRLVWRGRPLALLPGDVERAGIDRLLATGRDLRAEVLVVPHHGSANSLCPGLYSRVAPRLALAGTGFLNYLGFPAEGVRAALAGAGAALYDTGRCGAVRVSWADPQAPARLETALGCRGTAVMP